MRGGSGGDWFFLAPGKDSDGISDFADGEDRLVVGGGLSFAQLAISASDNGTEIALKSNGEILAVLTAIDVNQIGQDDFTFFLS
ncbi:hypothetical protein [Microseira wollei]|uniref:Hemolysin-type calcium-binding region n=1 Tax=Microseira wollei NIES-4236 TaxID=2530354 RepID=A0AAV3XS35_9CYAN|nr:hemolysin-type calcium-binding region [Microseira wollei NIES-4236]